MQIIVAEHNWRRLVEWATHAKPPKNLPRWRRWKAHKFSHHPEKFTRVHLLSFLTSMLCSRAMLGRMPWKIDVVCLSERKKNSSKKKRKTFPDIFHSSHPGHRRCFFRKSFLCLPSAHKMPPRRKRVASVRCSDEWASCFSWASDKRSMAELSVDGKLVN